MNDKRINAYTRPQRDKHHIISGTRSSFKENVFFYKTIVYFIILTYSLHGEFYFERAIKLN